MTVLEKLRQIARTIEAVAWAAASLYVLKFVVSITTFTGAAK